MLISKDVTIIVLDPSPKKQLVEQLCKCGRNDFIVSGILAKTPFQASGSALVNEERIETNKLQDLIHKLTSNRNSEKREATTDQQICVIENFEPSELITCD